MADTVAEYLADVPEKRAEFVRRLYEQITKHIDPAFEETMSYGMIGWVVPKSVYPAGYHCDPDLPVPFMNLANQKGHIGVYHMGLTADTQAWFVEEYAATGWKLNMGAACIRFTAMSRIPYDLIGELAGKISCDAWVASYAAADPRNAS